MRVVVGVMTTSAAAARATGALALIGIPPDHISRASPGAADEELRAIPTTDAEQPGIGSALGTVVGGTMGVAGGAAVAALALPGVGPVTLLGALAPLLLGVGGAIGGAAAGTGLDHALTGGLPKDELYVYEDALRHGRSLVIAVVDDGAQAEAAREVLAREGAESVDAAREHWWLGLRDAEAEAYTREGGDFERDEERYRLGFDAACQLKALDQAYDAIAPVLRERHGDAAADPAFRAGYERRLAQMRAVLHNTASARHPEE